MKKFVFAAILLAMGLSLQAQISTYLPAGKSGAGLQVLGEQGPKFQGFGATLNGTYKGKIDLTLFGARDVYGKAANDLITDKGLGSYYEVKATWWLFRTQITPGIEANFGLMAGYDGATFKDMVQINPETGSNSEYNGFSGGMAGIHTSVNLSLNSKWTLQPSFVAYYDMGKDFTTENGVKSSTTYVNVISNIGISMIRRIGEGNAFVLSANNFYMSTSAGGFYNLMAGYVFAF
jgi:hypothetical protein